MSRTKPNERTDIQARIIEGLAIDITRALEHVQRELAGIDWHPADTMPQGGSSNGGHASPTERAALARSELTGRREDIRDWITALEGFTRSGRFLVDETLKIRTPHTDLFDAADYGVRCRQPECTQWGSDHRLPKSGTVVHDWCDQHWISTACHVCGTHAHENRRLDGVRCCQAAYKKHQRDTIKEVA
jgi:hypothetical protein